MAILSFVWPFRFSSASTPEIAEDEDAIKASVISILTTSPRERVMRPTLGTEAWSLVFETASPVLVAQVRLAVTRALRLGEPRIRVTKVDVTVEDTALIIGVEYAWNGSQERVDVEMARVSAV